MFKMESKSFSKPNMECIVCRQTIINELKWEAQNNVSSKSRGRRGGKLKCEMSPSKRRQNDPKRSSSKNDKENSKTMEDVSEIRYEISFL